MKQLNRDKLLFGWVNSRGVPSPVLRKTTTTVISSAGTNGQCQQTAGIGPFSGDNVICSDGSKGRRLCKVRIYHTRGYLNALTCLTGIIQSGWKRRAAELLQQGAGPVVLHRDRHDGRRKQLSDQLQTKRIHACQGNITDALCLERCHSSRRQM
jgi:hypothetical protein